MKSIKSIKSIKSLNQDLLNELVKKPEKFNLAQALRIIILTNGKNYAECLQYLKHKILVKSWLSLAFPSKSIISFRHNDNYNGNHNGNNNDNNNNYNYNQQNNYDYTLEQTEFGLYSTLGPLPTFYTEELLDDLRNDEPVSRDFLDIINNHLYKLNYQVSLQYKFSRCYYELQDYHVINIVKNLLGEATHNLNNSIEENNKNNPNNLFTNSIPLAFLPFLMYKEKTADNLEVFLKQILNLEKNKLNIFNFNNNNNNYNHNYNYYYNDGNNVNSDYVNANNNSMIEVKIEQCVAKTIKLKFEYLCLLGKQNNELGNTALLGSYKKNSGGHFRIHLYNLNEFYFYELQQKNARLFILLQQAVKWFLDSPLTYDVVLHPKVRNTQKFALGSPHFLGRYLGKNLTNVGNKVIIYNS